MKITDIKTICLKYPYENFIADGNSACFGRGALLIQVETDTEITGLGECATFGASMSAMADVIENQLKGLLIGQNPLDIERLWETMVWSNFANGRRGIVMGAISGIDIALWDIAGKAAGLPLYRLLGANSDKVQGYASAGFYAPEKSVDDLKREMEGYMRKGYTAFKMKVGRCRNLIGMPHRYVKKGDFTISFEEDMARVAAVRETIGKDGILMLDMNCTWDVDQVLAAANVHFAASLPNVPFIESEENYNPLRTELLKEPIECDGQMNYLVPQKPGLGVELNMDVVEKYRA